MPSRVSRLRLVYSADTVRSCPVEWPSAATIWRQVQKEAGQAMSSDPFLRSSDFASLFNQPSLESAIVQGVALRLQDDALAGVSIASLFEATLQNDEHIGAAFRADLVALFDAREGGGFLQPLLYSKGFYALQAHRLTHWLWTQGRTDLALFLQCLASGVLQADIHPAVRMGKGIVLEEATGLVIGQTAIIEDDVTIGQNVTLGGTGTATGARHPKIRRGATIGAGARILGDVEIGRYATIVAGSVVTDPVPPYVTVAGVPATILAGPAAQQELFQDAR